PSVRPMALERTGAESWSLRTLHDTGGPFDPPHDGDVILTPTPRRGTPLVSASEAIFQQQDAGSLIQLTHAGQYQTADVDGENDATESIRVTGTGSGRTFYYSVTGSFSATIVLERSVGNEQSW